MAVYAIAAIARFKRGRSGQVLQHFEVIIMAGKDSEATRVAAVEKFRESFEKTELSRTGWYILRAPVVLHLDQEKLITMVQWASKPEPPVVEQRRHLRVVEE